MNLQIRIRTDASFEKLDYIRDWLDACDKGFAFEHNIPDNHHYHIYLFGLGRNPDAMRRYLGRHLPSKECYAVSKTCGKAKKIVDIEGAYTYGTTSLLLVPVWIRGITDDQHDYLKSVAYKFWKGQPDEPIQTKEKRPPRVPYQQAVIASAMADWENYKRKQRDSNEKVDMKVLTSFICSAMREHGRGINPHLVRDCAYGILFDDMEYRDRIIRKINLDV